MKTIILASVVTAILTPVVGIWAVLPLALASAVVSITTMARMTADLMSDE